MAGKIKGITIEIGGDVQPLNKALEDVNKKSKDIQGELKQIDRLLKLDPKNTELVAQKQKLLADAVSNSKEKLDTLKEAQKQVEEQFKRGEIGEEQYRAVQREVIKAEQELKNLEKRLDDVNNKWKQAGEAVGAFGKKTTEIGKSLSMKVTAPIMGIAAASQLAWKEVDDALDTIVTKTGATGEAMKDFEGSFKNVAKTMPVDMQTVGDAIGEVNTQFGLTGPALEEASAKAIKFSEINGQDVSKTAIDARQAIEAFELSTSDLGMVLDAVTKTAQDTGQATDVLFDRVTKGAPQLKAMGLEFAEGVAIMGKFEQAGVDSSKALSYLAKAQVVFAKDGKTLEQGMADVVKQMKGAKDETEALTIASQVFGAKGATFMYDAIQRGALNFDDFAGSLANAAGAVESTFEATLDPADQMKVALNNLKLVGADLGATIQETLAPMIDKLVGWLQKASEWFDKLSPGAKKMIVVVGGIAAAIGPLLVVIGTIASGIGAIIPMLAPLGAAIGAISLPVLGVVAAVAALAAIVYLVIKNWDKVKEFFSNLWEGIKNIFSAVWEWVKDLFLKYHPIGILFTHWEEIKEFFSGLWDRVKEIFSAVWEWIKEMLFKYHPIGILFTHWEGIKDFFTGLWDKVKNTFSTVWEYIKNLVVTAWNSIVNFFTGTRDKFINIFQVIKDKVLSIWSGIVSGIKGFVNRIIDAINSMIRGMNRLKWDVPDWVPIIGGKSWGISIPLIPYLAKGGDILQSGWAMVGEQGPEMVHLPRGAQVKPLSGNAGAQKMEHSGTITVQGVNNRGELIGAVDIVLKGLDDYRVQDKIDQVGYRSMGRNLRPQGAF